jgi:hypothetical protein
VDTSRPLPRPEGPRVAACSSWVYDPSVTYRVRGISTATLLVYPGVVLIEQRGLPRGWGRVPAISHAWPTIVVQRIVWSHRANVPGVPTILLDIGGELGSAWVSFGRRDRVATTFRRTGFEVVEDVVRGWEAPHPLRLWDHPDLHGRVPRAVLERSWWSEKPLARPSDDGAPSSPVALAEGSTEGDEPSLAPCRFRGSTSDT